MRPHKIRRYGWISDLPGKWDMCFFAPPEAALPAAVDLRPHCPPVYDQGELGSCTANAIAGAVQFERMKQSLTDFTPSRLFIYYNERVIENTVASDSGAQIRDGIKSVASQGACPETEWPYDVSKFADAPGAQCYTDAVKDRAVQYLSVAQNASQLKGCLAAGFPVVIGFTVYESFEDAPISQTGIMEMPKPNEMVLGGHAVLVVGYNDEKQWYVVRNSWNESWGDKGYFYMPYAYLLDPNLAGDFWTVRLISP